LVRLVAALDASGEWALDGSPTCAHWVAEALDIEVCTARDWLRVGHALEVFDPVDDAFAQGRLSYSKVRPDGCSLDDGTRSPARFSSALHRSRSCGH
jgi:hypothetical protein